MSAMDWNINVKNLIVHNENGKKETPLKIANTPTHFLNDKKNKSSIVFPAWTIFQGIPIVLIESL